MPIIMDFLMVSTASNVFLTIVRGLQKQTIAGLGEAQSAHFFPPLKAQHTHSFPPFTSLSPIPPPGPWLKFQDAFHQVLEALSDPPPPTPIFVARGCYKKLDSVISSNYPHITSWLWFVTVYVYLSEVNERVAL